MKKIMLFVVLAMCAPATAGADQWVNGHIRRDGTYVQGYHRSSPNRNRYDNYSSQGNTNPYTGKRGHSRNEFSSPPAYNGPSGMYRSPRSHSKKSFGW